jgi:hypothetical protein
MLDDLKPLFFIVLVFLNVTILPMLLLCFFMDWRVALIPLVIPLMLFVREMWRQSKAQIPPSEYKAPSPETLEEYIKLVQKDDEKLIENVKTHKEGEKKRRIRLCWPSR